MENFLGLLDGWLQFKATQIASEQPLEVHLRPHIGIHIRSDDFTSEHWVIEEPAAVLPMQFFEAQPVVGKRVITLYFESADGETLDILFFRFVYNPLDIAAFCMLFSGVGKRFSRFVFEAGNSWAFRARLDALGVMGSYHDDGSSKKYYRVLKNLSPVLDRQKIDELLGNGVFKKLAMRAAVLGSAPKNDSSVGVLIEELREVPHLHWVKT